MLRNTVNTQTFPNSIKVYTLPICNTQTMFLNSRFKDIPKSLQSLKAHHTDCRPTCNRPPPRSLPSHHSVRPKRNSVCQCLQRQTLNKDNAASSLLKQQSLINNPRPSSRRRWPPRFYHWGHPQWDHSMSHMLVWWDFISSITNKTLSHMQVKWQTILRKWNWIKTWTADALDASIHYTLYCPFQHGLWKTRQYRNDNLSTPCLYSIVHECMHLGLIQSILRCKWVVNPRFEKVLHWWIHIHMEMLCSYFYTVGTFLVRPPPLPTHTQTCTPHSGYVDMSGCFFHYGEVKWTYCYWYTYLEFIHLV